MRMLILILVFMVGLTYANKSVNARSNAQNERADVQGQAAPAKPPVNQASIETPSGPIQHPESESEKSKSVTRAEKIQIGINVILALAVIGQMLIYWQQRNIMRISQRAYIGIKETGMNNLRFGEKPFITVIFLNGGSTPAWKLMAPARLTLGEDFPHERPDVKREGTSFLPAGTEREVTYPVPIVMTTAWLAAIEKGAKKIFLNGEVHFEDCWHDKRVFPFQLVYNPDTDKIEDYKGEKTEPEVIITP